MLISCNVFSLQYTNGKAGGELEKVTFIQKQSCTNKDNPSDLAHPYPQLVATMFVLFNV